MKSSHVAAVTTFAVLALLSSCARNASIATMEDAYQQLTAHNVSCEPRFGQPTPEGADLICSTKSTPSGFRVDVVPNWDAWRPADQGGTASYACYTPSDADAAQLGQPVVIGDSYFSVAGNFPFGLYDWPPDVSPQLVAEALGGQVATQKDLLEKLGVLCK